MDAASRLQRSVGRSTVEKTQCSQCDLSHLCFPDQQDIDPAYLKNLIQQDKTYKRGDTIFRAGQPCKQLSAICSGSVKASMNHHNGSAQVTGFHFAGDMLGMDALGEQQYLYDATALEQVKIRTISYEQLTKLSEEKPELQKALNKLMSDQLAYNHQLLMPMVGKKSAAQLLASYLMALAQRFKKRGLPDTEFRLTMSRSDIANYLGLAKETVSRLFTRFESENLITANTKYITIKNPERLAALTMGSEHID